MRKGDVDRFIVWFIIMLIIAVMVILSGIKLYQQFTGR